MKKTKKMTLNVIISLIIIITACFGIMLFFCVPNGDALEQAMERNDYITLADVDESTPILGVLLPEGADRSITFTKNVNLDFKTVTVIYFNEYESLKLYRDSLNPNEGEVVLTRGKALFIGTKAETTSARWIIWA